MRKIMWVSLVVAVALIAAPATGQQKNQRGQGRGGFGFGGGGGSLLLLTAKSVQEELKCSADQVKEIEELSAKQREAFGGLRDLSQEERVQKMQEMAKKNQEAVDKLLKPEQQKRLKQIALQASGVAGLANNSEAATALGLSDEQKEKLQSIQRAGRQGFGDLQGLDREEIAKRMAEQRKAREEKAMEVLTAEQKAKWKEMTGEPVKDLPPVGGFGFGAGFGKGKRNKQ